MIINLKNNLLEFIKSHNLSCEDIDFVSYKNVEDGEIYHCDLIDFIEVAEDIDFEDYDPLIKHRDPLSDTINIVADEWYICRSKEAGAIWELHVFPETGEYDPVCMGDLIDPNDNINSDVVEMLDIPSPNGDYARDSIEINGEDYRIMIKDGIERVVNNKGHVAIITACNPLGKYWTQPHAGAKDPQMLFHPALVKSVMEYQASISNEDTKSSYNLRDGDIASVLNLEEVAERYNLNASGFNQEGFNNLEVTFVYPNSDYQITFMGAASHPELRHEIITRLLPSDVIKV